MLSNVVDRGRKSRQFKVEYVTHPTDTKSRLFGGINDQHETAALAQVKAVSLQEQEKAV